MQDKSERSYHHGDLRRAVLDTAMDMLVQDGNWQFTLRGIYVVEDPKQKGQENVLFFHWKYFDEANDYVKGRVGWWIVEPANGDAADRVAHQHIEDTGKAVAALLFNE